MSIRDFHHRAPAALLLALVACGDTPSETPDASTADVASDVADASVDAATDADALPPIVPTEAGPYGVAYRVVDVTVGERTLPVGVWTASEGDATTASISELVSDDRAEQMNGLVEAGNAACFRSDFTLSSVSESLPTARGLVVYSHCHECLGISGATVAERLASWGYVVLTPDHVDNTLWNLQADDGVALGGAFLEVRGGDIMGLIDAVEAGTEPLADIAAMVSTEQVAVVGHSFGAVTAGWVAERDERVAAAVALAAPIENPVMPGVTVENVDVPMLFVIAKEDNSIQEFGNTLIRNNFEDVAGEAMKVEIADAGHWSVSDLCGLVEAFDPGCGVGERHQGGAEFDYIDPDVSRALTAELVLGYVAAHLSDDAGASAYLDALVDTEVIEVARR